MDEDPKIFLNLRHITLPCGRGWEITTNPLADLFLLGSINIRKNWHLPNRSVLMLGAGAFRYFGDYVTSRVAHLFMKEIREVETELHGGRLFLSAGIPFSTLTAFLGGEVIRINQKILYCLAAGIRWKPGQVFSLNLETGYLPAEKRIKPGIAASFSFTRLNFKLGVIYNPINDPGIRIPAIPVFDIGVKL